MLIYKNNIANKPTVKEYVEIFQNPEILPNVKLLSNNKENILQTNKNEHKYILLHLLIIQK